MTAHPGPWRIDKFGYSADPWRIIDANGAEMYRYVPDWREGMPPYPAPLAYATKTAAVAALGAIAGEQAAEVERLEALVDGQDRRIENLIEQNVELEDQVDELRAQVASQKSVIATEGGT
jgi:hypothetical protein